MQDQSKAQISRDEISADIKRRAREFAADFHAGDLSPEAQQVIRRVIIDPYLADLKDGAA
ncbi:hypothetical protein [Gordonia sp. NPDC003376]